MPRDDLREAVRSLADSMHSKHGVKPRWQGDAVRMKSRGVDGHLDFSGDTIDISVRLGMLASAFAPKIRTAIETYLDQHVS